MSMDRCHKGTFQQGFWFLVVFFKTYYNLFHIIPSPPHSDLQVTRCLVAPVAYHKMCSDFFFPPNENAVMLTEKDNKIVTVELVKTSKTNITVMIRT